MIAHVSSPPTSTSKLNLHAHGQAGDRRGRCRGLSVPVGKWPAGTTGTAVSIYDDAALVEIAEDEPPGRALDMINVPFSQLELVWSGRTGWVDGWKPDGSPSHLDPAAKRSADSE